MITKFSSTRIVATCSKKAGNDLTDPQIVLAPIKVVA
jgi:hypothetical protein